MLYSPDRKAVKNMQERKTVLVTGSSRGIGRDEIYQRELGWMELVARAFFEFFQNIRGILFALPLLSVGQAIALF